MRDYLNDARLSPLRRQGKAMPMEYAYVCVAERFGGWPWDIPEAPADSVARCLNLLAAEGEFKSDLAGLEADEPMFWEDDEG